MPKKSREMPEKVKIFCNLLWASFPGYYIVKFLFHSNTVFVSIVIKFENHKKHIRRQYSQKIIDSHKDLWGMVRKCSVEIKKSINKIEE